MPSFPQGVWPTMITPFTADNDVDYPALARLVAWYISQGVDGLFAVCQSSEMFFLSDAEKVAVAAFVKQHSSVPVIASGHTADSLTDQIAQLQLMATSGVDAIVLISNRMAAPYESDEVWLQRLQQLMDALPANLPLGMYECPHPYKRLLTADQIDFLARSGRFHFIKDTSCDAMLLTQRIEQTAKITNTPLQLFNANSALLLHSLQVGGAGFSGVMANFHPALYVQLCHRWQQRDSEPLSDFLSMASLHEMKGYPLNAKHYQAIIGNGILPRSRATGSLHLNETALHELQQLKRLSDAMEAKYVKEV